MLINTKHVFVYKQQYHDVRHADKVRLLANLIFAVFNYYLIVLNIVYKLISFFTLIFAVSK
jgi:hypothetical protein